ncbi:MAG: adenylate/guanylate cyclase domain-containing protein [Bacteroidota bacterium]
MSSLPLAAWQGDQLVDSLHQLIKAAKEDTHKVHLLNDLAWEYKIEKAEEARKLLAQSALLARRLAFPKGEAQAYNNWGVVESIHEQYDLARDYFRQSLAIRKELGDLKGMASLYNNIGNLDEEQDRFAEAIFNLRQSLSIREELKDTLRIARTSYNIAVAFEARGFYPEALDYVLTYLRIAESWEAPYEIANAYNLLGNIKTELERFEEAAEHYEKALHIRQELKDQWELAIIYTNIGNNKDDFGEAYFKEERYPEAYKNYQEALGYHQNALDIYQAIEDREGEAQAYNNLGVTYKNLGSYYHKALRDGVAEEQAFQQALAYLNRSLEIWEDLDKKSGIMKVYNGLGDVYRRQQKYTQALQYTNDYLQLADELGDSKFQQKAYKDLSRVYADLDQYERAYRFRKQYDETRYERLSEERVRLNSRREVLYGDLKNENALQKQKSQLELQEANLREASLQRRTLLGGLIALLLLAILLYNRYRIKHKANLNLEEKNQIIEQERERAETLLLNILPAQTAEELKSTGRAKAKRYDSVTVLFTDFQSFTKLAGNMEAEALVADLDECFRAFDEITARYGIEKIKTIGDAYMCVAGLPEKREDHAQAITAAAIDMQAFMRQFNEAKQLKGAASFPMRLGIHSGPVVAGIVGSRKFAYDIWGDTVNLASRMESNGESGKINISKATYSLVKDRFNCRPRGKLSVKHMGEVEMYFVEGYRETVPKVMIDAQANKPLDSK